jgi:hypothetical protein
MLLSYPAYQAFFQTLFLSLQKYFGVIRSKKLPTVVKRIFGFSGAGVITI